MSVYTELTFAELETFVAQFDCGALTGFQGVDAGVENTTYFVSLSHCEAVLQIFEEQGFDEIPFFIELNRQLSDDHVPVARPLANQDGERLFSLKGKPAALFSRLKGTPLTEVNADACSQIGQALGAMHHHTQSYHHLTRRNHRWSAWWRANHDRVNPFVADEYRALLAEQIERSESFVRQSTELPNGIIHGDLFIDNALFDGSQLAGIIDFYNACNGAFVYDLAVAVNDWCSDASGRLHAERTAALIGGYQMHRSLTSQEVNAWPDALETAALRFWMLRLVGLARKHEGGPQAPPHVKDPNDFLKILQTRRADPQCELLQI
jgi:homoserine kinase type II